MEARIDGLQQTRRELEEKMPEVYRTLNNWSLEPSWQRAAGDWTSVLCDYLQQEAAYRSLLEETVIQLQERVSQLEGRHGSPSAFPEGRAADDEEALETADLVAGHR